MNLKDFRIQYPQYNDMPDSQLVNALHSKFYPDMPLEDFSNKIGYQQPGGGALGAFVDKATGMMTFGLNKPINAALEAGIDTVRGKGKYGDLYDKYVADQTAQEKANSEIHPIASGAGDVAGVLGSLGGMVANGAKATATAAPGAWNTAKNIIGQVRNNALIGAGVSEANAVGNTPGSLSDKVASAYPAGVGGAAIGAAVPLAAQGAVSGGAALLSKSPPAQAAIKKIADKFALDNITPDQAQVILAHSPGASLADVGDTNVQSLGKSIFNTPSTGARNASNFLLSRDKQMGGRVQDMVSTGFGNNANFYDTANNLIATRQEAAKPLYQGAYQANPSMASPELNRILDTPAGGAALKDSVRIMQNNRKLVGMSDPELVEQAKLVGSYEPGSGGIAPGLNMETLDNTKKALDLAYKNSGYKDNSILSVKNDLLAEMDRLDATNKTQFSVTGQKVPVPGTGLYAQGRSAFSSPSQSLDALEAGRNFMKDDPEVSAQNLANIDPADKPFFQIGAARAMSDKAGDNPGVVVKNVVNNPNLQAKLQAVMPSQDEYFGFLTGAQNELNMKATKNAVLGNSSTVKQAVDLGADATSKLPFGLNWGNLFDAAQGNVGGALLQAGKTAISKANAPSPEIANEMGKALFSSDPNQNAATIQAWKGYLQNPGVPFSLSPQVGALGAQTGAIAYGQ